MAYLQKDQKAPNLQLTTRFSPGEADAPIYLKWRSLSAGEINESFDVSIGYRCVPRGTNAGESDGYTPWYRDGTVWTNIPLSECNGRQSENRSGWQWSYDLATLLERCGIKEAFTDTETFGFDARKFDQVQLDIHIKSQYLDGFTDKVTGGGYSPRTDTMVWLDYHPEYVIERIYCDTLGEVKFEYSASGWERVDDRWCLMAFEAGDKSLLLDVKPWGTVVRHDSSGAGTVIVPIEKMNRAVPVDEVVYARIKFNPSYQANGADFVEAETSATCENNALCNTPTLTVTQDGGKVYVHVADSGDKGKPIASCLVKLEGSELSLDQQIVAAGETAVFSYLPKGVELVFTAIATAGEGTLSSSATAICEALDPLGALTIISLKDPSLLAVARWNVQLEDEYAPEREVIKLAGRRRACSYYGTGGEGGFAFSFDILPEEHQDDEMESEEAWRKAANSGDCLMFLKNGERKAISVSSIKFAKSYNTPVSAVTASLTEVDV